MAIEYYEGVRQAFALASVDKKFDMVHPWYDLISTLTIQMMMIIALASISVDVFGSSTFGSGIKCTPIYRSTIYSNNTLKQQQVKGNSRRDIEKATFLVTLTLTMYIAL